MSITSRHHFIPQFYLRNFTNEQGKFYIYLVKQDKFKEKGKLFSPKQAFFEWDANTIKFDGVADDFIEKSYSDNDKLVSDIVKKIASDNFELTKEEWVEIQFFINTLYWRCPCNVGRVKEFIQNIKSLAEIRKKVINRDTGENETKEFEAEVLTKMKSDPDFYKMIKRELPIITFNERFTDIENDFANIHAFPQYELIGKLVSDNPIIYRQPGIVSLHQDEFIFQIYPNHFLFRTKYAQFTMWSHFRALVDMMQIVQANEYVSCTSMEYPRSLMQLYNERYKSVEKLRKALFSTIWYVTKPETLDYDKATRR